MSASADNKVLIPCRNKVWSSASKTLIFAIAILCVALSSWALYSPSPAIHPELAFPPGPIFLSSSRSSGPLEKSAVDETFLCTAISGIS
jgi:hypothetical protein